MTIQQCKYVLKIAECGSFNEAAKQLFIAQSSLSISVKSLEQELNIKIFERSGNGVFLTNDGTEFVIYARQIVEQSDFVINRYTEQFCNNRLHVATQHYDFVADIFAKMINNISEKQYKFSLKEMKTYDVIRETENAIVDIGIIAIKEKDSSIMERYISKKGITFTPLFTAKPHVFVRKEHPLSKNSIITLEKLKDFPYVSYEQGEHNALFFTEEITNIHSEKHVEISDRATFMNLLLQTNCYTIGTGIMPSLLNEGRIVSIPFECDDSYSIGYMVRNDRSISELTKDFIELLKVKIKNS